MPRKRLPEEERKETFNIRLKLKTIREIRKIKGYNKIIGDLIEKYLKERKD